jgi:hypothetical protein
MVIVWGVVAIVGGAVTAVALWSTSALLAILLAPLGGSLSVLVGAALLSATRIRQSKADRSGDVPAVRARSLAEIAQRFPH